MPKKFDPFYIVTLSNGSTLHGHTVGNCNIENVVNYEISKRGSIHEYV